MSMTSFTGDKEGSTEKGVEDVGLWALKSQNIITDMLAVCKPIKIHGAFGRLWVRPS
jgi:hypothetical protein